MSHPTRRRLLHADCPLPALAATNAYAQDPPPPPDAAFAPASPDAISFTAVVGPVVTGGLGYSDVAWGDYNNDGLLDFMAGGWGFSGSGIWVYRNTGFDFTRVYTTYMHGADICCLVSFDCLLDFDRQLPLQNDRRILVYLLALFAWKQALLDEVRRRKGIHIAAIG